MPARRRGWLKHLADGFVSAAQDHGVLTAVRHTARAETALRAFRAELLSVPTEEREKSFEGRLFMIELAIQRAALARPQRAARRVPRRVAAVPITPHLVVQGAEAAGAFYRDAFGAREVGRIPAPDGRLMSLEMRIGGAPLRVADEFPELGVLAPPSVGGSPIVMALDVADADAVFARAVGAGADVHEPLADTFWGARHGQLDDPFGHRWNVSQHLRDVPQDEILAASRAFAA